MPKDPPSIFSFPFALQAAEGHVSAGQKLYEAFDSLVRSPRPTGTEIDMVEAMRLGAPALMNLSLGLEILLKAHHFQTTGIYPQGHDIQKLGRTLPENSLTNLRGEYLKVRDDPNTSGGLIFRFSFGGGEKSTGAEFSAPDVSTFDLAISYIGTTYVKWRYFYEQITEQADMSVNFAPIYQSAIAVHRVVKAFRGNIKISANPKDKDE